MKVQLRWRDENVWKDTKFKTLEEAHAHWARDQLHPTLANCPPFPHLRLVEDSVPHNDRERIKFEPFSYGHLERGVPFTPENYTCDRCLAHGVRLWRLWNIFMDAQEMYCARCCSKEELSPMPSPDWAGSISCGPNGGMSPAVPTEDGYTFWGFSSVPEAGVTWWRKLPLFKE